MLPGSPRVLEQHQLERWVGDRKVGVAGLRLGRADAEHPGVEVDGRVEVADVEGELQAHQAHPFIVDVDQYVTNVSIDVNMFAAIRRSVCFRLRVGASGADRSADAAAGRTMWRRGSAGMLTTGATEE